ncbi:MAG: hypothetical protein WCF91_03750 [bacterium]
MNLNYKNNAYNGASLMKHLKALLYKYSYRIYRLIRRFIRSINGLFQSLVIHFSPRALNRCRILLVYDTSSQPFSVGDLLICQEASLVLCEEYGVDIVDFAIVYDPENPASSDPVFATSITRDNVLFSLASILPLAQVNQRLGSVFIFNSHKHLQYYINDNAERYHVWPSSWKVATREYLSPVVFNDLLYRHYKKRGSIPLLTCRPYLKDWAEEFYRDNLSGQVPVTVNIRNNKRWHLHRNSQLDCWIDFFRYCETRYPAKFVVICAHSEIDARLRQCTNVILAKDCHTSIEQDMALIHSSAIHMGAGSGPATMAWFNNKPYLMVNTTYKAGEFFEQPGMIHQVEEGIQRFWFAGPLQRIANGTESTELLIREIAKLWEVVDVQYWQAMSRSDDRAGTVLNIWLR